MSLADRVANFTPTQRMQCHTCAWLKTLPPEELEAFNQFLNLIDNKQASRAQVIAILREEGLDAGESSFARHLRDCREPR